MTDGRATDDAPLLAEVDGALLVVTLNRPAKLNALNLALMRGLAAAVARFRDDPALKVMLIRATGRYFSAGADLREGDDSPPARTGSAIREMHRRLPSDMRRLWDEIEHIEKPFVVAHQGMCVGGSLEMSLSCDFRIASASAGYAFPEGKFGVLPATNGVSRLTRIVGPHWSRYLIMANTPVTAAQALTMGLVHEVHPDDAFEAAALTFCRRLAGQDGEFMGTAKLAIELAADLGVEQAGAVERLANSALMLSPGFTERLSGHVRSIGAADRSGAPEDG